MLPLVPLSYLKAKSLVDKVHMSHYRRQFLGVLTFGWTFLLVLDELFNYKVSSILTFNSESVLTVSSILDPGPVITICADLLLPVF